MICTTCYDSPLGKLTLAGKNNKLIGLWIEGQKQRKMMIWLFLEKLKNG